MWANIRGHHTVYPENGTVSGNQLIPLGFHQSVTVLSRRFHHLRHPRVGEGRHARVADQRGGSGFGAFPSYGGGRAAAWQNVRNLSQRNLGNWPKFKTLINFNMFFFVIFPLIPLSLLVSKSIQFHFRNVFGQNWWQLRFQPRRG